MKKRSGIRGVALRQPVWVAVVWALSAQLAVAVPARVVDDVEACVAQWFRLRLEMKREWNDWEIQRDALNRRIEHLEDEAEHRRERIAVLEDRMEAATVEAERLAHVLTLTDAQHAATVKSVQAVAHALNGFAGRLPESLQTSLPRADTPASTGEHVAQVLTLAAMLHRLDQQSHALRKRLETPEGDARQVDMLWLGLGQAFAVSRDDRLGARGLRHNNDWEWTWQADWAANIRQAIRVQRGDLSPRWVRLPLALMPEEAP